ncbi:MAG: class I SAM-dependent methyltransferase [Magnetococcales bacterium]|nr:class I SAM-dependent methyltransferase [Magnetococcales bacterium]
MNRWIAAYRRIVRAAAPDLWWNRRFVRRALTGFRPRVCLDLGAGSAPLEATVRQCVPAVRYWKTDLPPAFEQDWAADAARLPLRRESVDLALMMELLAHLPEPDQALAEARRVLTPGGRLLVSYRFLHGECALHDYHRWTHEGMTARLARAGFRILDHRRQGGLFFALTQGLAGVVPSLIPGMRGGWRSRRDGWGALRLATLVLLQLPFQLLGFVALALDRLLPLKGFYSGGMVLAEKPDDGAAGGNHG